MDDVTREQWELMRPEARGQVVATRLPVFVRPYALPSGTAAGFELQTGGCRVIRVLPDDMVWTESAQEILWMAWLTLERMLGE
jgi:hypothetical protein